MAPRTKQCNMMGLHTSSSTTRLVGSWEQLSDVLCSQVPKRRTVLNFHYHVERLVFPIH